MNEEIKEFHLFAGIGGGIYGGEILGHKCCAGVEILPYAQSVLRQRQQDGWMPKFPIYNDICALDGTEFQNQFDILCGGFPCQAFSTAAHGKNIEEKNLWGEMLRFVKQSNAPVVFAENVVLRAIDKAKKDLEELGYKVVRCRLSCSDIGADHQRNRFWLLAVKEDKVFDKIANHISTLPIIKGSYWASNIEKVGDDIVHDGNNRRKQLLGVGNAQSPFVVASAFRILVNRMLSKEFEKSEVVSSEEISKVFEIKPTWIQESFDNIGLVHTPTTMANYSCPSMMKHQGCRNFKVVFGRPEPNNAEYLMGFPIGASRVQPMSIDNFNKWKQHGTK
ncbi:MAG: DNA cytosine methyltransferase [Muribaculaceae bacterium]|nr:DNA cytosine methyltransferase [Muribaculaceae bacterium]